MKTMLLLTTMAVTLASNAFAIGDCDQLHGGSPAELISYLNSIVLREGSQPCIVIAIDKLGGQHYEPAIPLLLKFLDLRSPESPHGKRSYLTSRLGAYPNYPAEAALEKFGDKALPLVLQFLKTHPESADAVESAVAIWMNAYKDNPILGIALLKQEADKTEDRNVKGNLAFAAYKAQQRWCPPEVKAQCKSAALIRLSDGSQNSKDGAPMKPKN